MRPNHLLVLAISFTVFSTVSAEKNFNFATTPGKLPKQVRPETYAIRIAPDLEKLTFTGSETVKLDVQKPVRKLVLNALDLSITAASVDGKLLGPSAIKLDPKEETLALALPSEIPAGAHELLLNFNGKINAASTIHVARAIDEIEFRAEFKQRLIAQFSAWVKEHGKLPQ